MQAKIVLNMMKNASIYFLMICLTACGIPKTEQVMVVRDCTGTYVRQSGKDYLVCNPEKIASIPDNTLVDIKYKRIRTCNGSAKDDIVCLMAHENEGWITIINIK